MKEIESYFVGIAGGSCTGKTSVALEICKRNPGSTLIHFDDYIFSKDKIDYSSIINWETPDLYDLNKLIDDLRKLKKDDALVYSTHNQEDLNQDISPNVSRIHHLILVEGFLLFHDPGVRSQLNLRLFLDLPAEEMIKRRLARKIKDKPWDDEKYINTLLIKGHNDLVVPTKAFANFVIDSSKPVGDVADEVNNIIQTYSFKNS